MDKPEMVDDPRPCVICRLVRDMPVPKLPCTVRLCMHCRRQIWVTNSGFEDIAKHNMRLACNVCAEREMNEARANGDIVKFGDVDDLN